MTVARPRPKKATDIEESARVLRIFDMLVEELRRRNLARTFTGEGLLAIADRIAARTEDALGD